MEKPESPWPSECSPQHIDKETGMVRFRRYPDNHVDTFPKHPIFDREQANHNASGWIIPGLPRNPAPTGQPCPTVNHFPDGKINLSDHSSGKTAVQKDRLRQMLEQVLEKIPDNQFIVGFDLKILFDHENKPYLRHIAFGQLCDEQPVYPNLDMLRQLPQ